MAQAAATVMFDDPGVCGLPSWVLGARSWVLSCPLLKRRPGLRRVALRVRLLVQLGHQAANCTNGTINWRQIYGDEAFILRQPIFWSDIVAKRKAKEVNMDELTQRAKDYAQVGLGLCLGWDGAVGADGV